MSRRRRRYVPVRLRQAPTWMQPGRHVLLLDNSEMVVDYIDGYRAVLRHPNTRGGSAIRAPFNVLRPAPVQGGVR